MLNSEQSLLAGICPDCGVAIRKWDVDEIKAAKEDIGMGKNDEFSVVCDECMNKYMGVSNSKPANQKADWFNALADRYLDERQKR